MFPTFFLGGGEGGPSFRKIFLPKRGISLSSKASVNN